MKASRLCTSARAVKIASNLYMYKKENNTPEQQVAFLARNAMEMQIL